MRKKLIGFAVLSIMALMTFGATGCVKAEPEQTEITVFAAASLTETLNQITENYKIVNPNVSIICNFDSSGTLKTQIEEGAECDLFLSAAAKQMNQLDITADPEVNKDGLDFIDVVYLFSFFRHIISLTFAFKLVWIFLYVFFNDIHIYY